jgi:3-dehydroquinate synthase
MNQDVMRSVEVPLGDRSYPVLVGQALLARTGLWDDLLPAAPVVILSNDQVAPLYLESLMTGIGGRDIHQLILPDGEAQKSLGNWSRVMDFLVDIQATRDTCLLTLGGGVIGDLGGFAAATWMRGINFIQAPTTLLAQVDASVGGKTAINLAGGKNLVGAFHQPAAVVADLDTLATLADREYQAGLAEVVKYGAIRDPSLLDYLEQNLAGLLARDPLVLEHLVIESVRHKAEVVAADELETGQRATLNFGHSFAHALEALTQYRTFLHGEAVAMGMVAAARLAEQRGVCPQGAADRLEALQQAMGLPVHIPGELGTANIIKTMKLDKKNLAGKRRLVLLAGMGEAVIDSQSTDAEIARAIDACRN